MRLLSWIIGALDFRLYQMEGEGGGGAFTGFGPGAFQPPPAPTPAPEPEPEPTWAENRQVANIDRTSRYTHAEYRSALESIHQQSQAAGAAAEPFAQDYELPDTAFGERIY